ncbi:MAG: hypothetical protein JWM11_1604, partial [Planctomycetaceae bacterium]|nr:hypothetical protein [Planctomycetaceae bacterium]
MHLKIRNPAIVNDSIAAGLTTEPAPPAVSPQPGPSLRIKQIEPQIVDMQRDFASRSE